jgi:hypothetical protein
MAMMSWADVFGVTFRLLERRRGCALAGAFVERARTLPKQRHAVKN